VAQTILKENEIQRQRTGFPVTFQRLVASQGYSNLQYGAYPCTSIDQNLIIFFIRDSDEGPTVTIPPINFTKNITIPIRVRLPAM